MDLQASLDRVMRSETVFGTQFYKNFFESVPDSKAFFKGVDWHHQELSLTMALAVLVRHHDFGYPTTRMYLEHLGTRHRDREVPISLYEPWCTALLKTLAEIEGPNWTSELAASWRSAFDDALDAMLRGYEKRVHV
jgi:hemoglobin-like flavoprotein